MKLRVEQSNERIRGVALLYAVFGAFVAATMMAVMLTMAGVTNTTSKVKLGSVQAQYLAEGAVEAAKKQLVEAIANWDVPPATGVVTVGTTDVSFRIANTGGTVVSTDPSGIQTLVTPYEIEAQAQVDGYQARSNLAWSTPKPRRSSSSRCSTPTTSRSCRDRA